MFLDVYQPEYFAHVKFQFDTCRSRRRRDSQSLQRSKFIRVILSHGNLGGD